MADSEMSYLDCQVCFEMFDGKVRIPRLLLCGHTFCEVCLNSLEMNMTIQCPNKDGETKLGEKRALGLKKNFALLDLVEQFGSSPQSAQVDVVCENDCTTKATKFCEDCGYNFCDSCCLNVHKPAVFQKHRISGQAASKQRSDVRICAAHNEEYKLYCDDHKECICYLCAFSSHRGHHISTLGEVYDHRKAKFDEELNELRQEEQRLFSISGGLAKKSKELQANGYDAAKKVSEFCKDLRDEVVTMEKSVLKKIRNVVDAKASIILADQEYISTRISQLSTAIESGKQRSLCGDHVDFLSRIDETVTQMESAKNRPKNIKEIPLDVSVPARINRKTFSEVLESIISVPFLSKPGGLEIMKVECARTTAEIFWKGKVSKSPEAVGAAGVGGAVEPGGADGVANSLELNYSEDQKDPDWTSVILSNNVTSTNLSGLHFNCSYVARIRGRNDSCIGAFSELVSFKTKSGAEMTEELEDLLRQRKTLHTQKSNFEEELFSLEQQNVVLQKEAPKLDAMKKAARLRRNFKASAEYGRKLKHISSELKKLSSKIVEHNSEMVRLSMEIEDVNLKISDSRGSVGSVDSGHKTGGDLAVDSVSPPISYDDKCDFCGSSVSRRFRCGGCVGKVWYCDRTCQRKGWVKHKQICERKDKGKGKRKNKGDKGNKPK